MNRSKMTMTFLLTGLFCLQLFAYEKENDTQPTNNQSETENIDAMNLVITIGTSTFSVTLQKNATASAFIDQLPLTLSMSDLNNNEKYFDLPESLSRNVSNPETIQNGDLMLYGSNTLVLFYKTFSTSYSYTRLGKIENPFGLSKALGSGNVTVIFELAPNSSNNK